MRRRLTWAATLLALLAAPTAGGRDGGRAGDLSLERHRFAPQAGDAVDAELGWLAVPENRQRPSPRLVHLAFVRFRSTAAQPGPPIVFLAGGPGGSGIDSARGALFPLFMELRRVADVVALDQRGTGMSRPGLVCRESWRLPPDRPGDAAAMLAAAREHSRACAAFLSGEGHDLGGYNLRESAEDLEALRRALGAPRLSLLGISYGSRLALTAVRLHEQRIARVALAGIEGPAHGLRLPSQVEGRLAALARLVRDDAAAGREVPDLLALMRTVLERLARQPVTARVPGRAGGDPGQVVIGPFDLQLFTARALGGRDEMARLPALYLAMSRGDFSGVAPAVARARTGWLGSALPYAVHCASGVAPERWRRILEEEPRTLLGRALDFPYPEICDAWEVPSLGETFRSPVQSRVPALFISGTLDARTPLDNAREVARGFVDGRELLIEGGGHGDDLLLSAPEIGQTLARFLRGEPVRSAQVSLAPITFQVLDPPPVDEPVSIP